MTHRFRADLHWSGSTAAGYENYDRTHLVTAQDSEPLEVSAAPAFHGAPGRHDPEQLLLMAAASCQLLSFLTVAARARLDVVDYADRAQAQMPPAPTPMRITRIVLNPTITLRPGPAVERVEHLVQVAHRECFVANTLACEFEIRPTVRFTDAVASSHE